MPQGRPPDYSPDRFEDSPVAWFAELLLSLGRGDFHRAAESHRQLNRLGWNVTRRKPRQAERQGVAR
jgi:hypothetical protein